MPSISNGERAQLLRYPLRCVSFQKRTTPSARVLCAAVTSLSGHRPSTSRLEKYCDSAPLEDLVSHLSTLPGVSSLWQWASSSLVFAEVSASSSWCSHSGTGGHLCSMRSCCARRRSARSHPALPLKITVNPDLPAVSSTTSSVSSWPLTASKMRLCFARPRYFFLAAASKSSLASGSGSSTGFVVVGRSESASWMITEGIVLAVCVRPGQ
eukprot:5217437-Prymnesium_polylepis.1